MAEIAKFKVIRWILYLAMMFNSYMLNQNISNNLKFIIGEKVWCPAFGSNARCDVALLHSIIGIISGASLFLMGILDDDTKKLKFFNKNESILCLIQVPIWIGFFINIFQWTKEMETSAFEINCIYISILANISFLICSGIVSYIEKGVRISREN
ncbi:hypothetical protein HAN_3g465 (nucleomorph) [Hemiselmis andersenii]|uniref:Uncharacterized protein n=1 Tax=Hemiselmis andersenii TaxID=464988 RepID=A9BL84_HEMAN|nr:hypothetical protein HAN_3g465 [Hemiselmis andersenii]ABW98267.1 hypothetical protein HAN_3g465 [Hemiselmis andersenii]|mmetsp:Transcript_2768/g.6203  ORF Transcript_2768/g.6203 Transcript_2768/m.6203 type:complete len:155 (-) Transcript_2768:180-644(-)